MRDLVRRITCAELCFFWWILGVFFNGFSVFALAVNGDSQLASSHTEPNLHRTGKYKDELRCHCNLPLCVTTGYMCKSSVGTCFSEIVDFQDLSKSRHGCVELLSSKKLTLCHNQTESAKSSLICCKQDLCNFNAEQAHVRTFHATFRNRSESNGIFEFNPSELNSISGSVPSHVASKDLWLKAATIAVPIAGAFILILLVLLAIRILKRDRRAGRVSGYYGGHWNSGSDFQIRRVWGKARQGAHQQEEQQRGGNLLWRDVQPMLNKNNTQPPRIMKLTMTGNTVYLPTTLPAKSSWWKDSRRVRPIHEV